MAYSNMTVAKGQEQVSDKQRIFQKSKSPEEIEQRKRCIWLTRDYYLAIDIATEQLNAIDKLPEKQEVIDREKKRIYRNLLGLIEKCLNNADWSISLFFQGIGNRIRAMRDKIRQCLAETDEDFLSPEAPKAISQAREGMTLVYVSLYQADGLNLRKWATLLDSITKLSIGRPVYLKQSAIEAVIRAKPEPRRDAYVAIYVNDDDIIEPLGGIHPKDRMGNQLLTIREGKVLANNISHFVHNTGSQIIHYEYKNHKLIQKEDN